MDDSSKYNMKNGAVSVSYSSRCYLHLLKITNHFESFYRSLSLVVGTIQIAAIFIISWNLIAIIPFVTCVVSTTVSGGGIGSAPYSTSINNRFEMQILQLPNVRSGL